MLILSIESSCDETCAAVVEMGDGIRRKRFDIIASQVGIHALYGGVVPEIASRAHIEAVSRITYQALKEANVTLDDIDVIGVTNRPGLIGALLVGLSFAKSLAAAYNKPLVPVNHIRAHTAAAYLAYPGLEPPFTSIVVSGGHTSIFDVRSYTDYVTIGSTRDDAAGEAFDKVGRVMGLPYPGGAAMDRLASAGNPNAIHFPSPAISGDTLDYSFSGLKTAVINYIHNCTQKEIEFSREDVAASFTHAVVSGIAAKLSLALDKTGNNKIVLAGGVAANSHLRRAVTEMAQAHGAEVFIPPLSLCGDNGAMVGAQCYYEFLDGKTAGFDLNAYAS